MGTTAEKLTYLGVTKEKIRDSINLTGAGLTSSDTFRSYATKLNKGYVDIINNGIDTLYENFPKVSGMDSNLSLTPTYEAPMNNDELYGDTRQSLLPEGFTQVDYIEKTDATSYIDTKIELGDNFKIDLDFALTEYNHNAEQCVISTFNSTNNYWNLYVKPNSPVDNLILYVKGHKNISNEALTLNQKNSIVIERKTNNWTTSYNGTSTTFSDSTLTTNNTTLKVFARGDLNNKNCKIRLYSLKVENTYNIVGYFIPCYRNSDNEVGLYDLVTKTFFANNGTGTLTYNSVLNPTIDTPMNIESVTGEQNIEICGKNLLNTIPDRNSTNGVTVTQNDDKSITLNGTSTANSWVEIDYDIKLNPGDYTLSIRNKKTGLGLYLGSENITTYGVTQNQANSYKTFTLENEMTFDKARIRIMSGTVFENFTIYPQLEKNSVVTEYKPYQSNTYEINLGKNLFDKDNISELRGTINNDNNIFTYSSTSLNYCFYMPCKPNTTYTIQKRNDGDTNRFKFGSCSTTISTQESAVTNLTVKASDDSASSLTIKTGTNDIYIIAQYYRSAETVLTKQQLLDSIQIEVGSQATTYSAYFTPIELNEIGAYQDSIKKSSGKNLFDKNNINELSGAINSAELKFTYSSTSPNRCFYIPCKPNTTYTIQKRNDGDTNRFKFASCSTTILTQDGAVTNLTTRVSNDSATSLTITTGANDIYIIAQYYQTTETVLTEQQILDSIQIEEGNNATSYEPYGKIWYIEKNINKTVLNGSENWGRGADYVYYIDNIVDYATDNNIPFSNYFKGINNVSGAGSMTYADDNTISFINSKANYRFYVHSTQFEKSSAFKTWLTTHNMDTYYVKETPTYEIITNEELVNQLNSWYNAKSKEEQTNITVTSENLPVILGVSALKGE